MSDDKVEVKESDMEEAEQSIVISVVREAQRLYNIDKDVAAFIKEELDKQLGATWHIICGKCFGSRVSYEMGHFLLLKCNKVRCFCLATQTNVHADAPVVFFPINSSQSGAMLLLSPKNFPLSIAR
ncbi:dynein light chain type 1 [Teladorsagia circumcincta]|uniref:Dynein light chain n=1 Tax=Teladorsagia circumcincta TaxID=45464 RepID=A0A2G9U0L9_TELCI|nr:dynein light chain type 1 [Teladorsagia circumcincta]